MGYNIESSVQCEEISIVRMVLCSVWGGYSVGYNVGYNVETVQCEEVGGSVQREEVSGSVRVESAVQCGGFANCLYLCKVKIETYVRDFGNTLERKS